MTTAKTAQAARSGRTAITIATKISTTTQEALADYLAGQGIPEWCALKIAAECFDRKAEVETGVPNEEQTWATIVYSPCPLFMFDRRWIIQIDRVDLSIMF